MGGHPYAPKMPFQPRRHERHMKLEIALVSCCSDVTQDECNTHTPSPSKIRFHLCLLTSAPVAKIRQSLLMPATSTVNTRVHGGPFQSSSNYA